MFKVDNKDASGVILVSLLLTLNIFLTLFQCFYCKLWTCNCRLGSNSYNCIIVISIIETRQNKRYQSIIVFLLTKLLGNWLFWGFFFLFFCFFFFFFFFWREIDILLESSLRVTCDWDTSSNSCLKDTINTWNIAFTYFR